MSNPTLYSPTNKLAEVFGWRTSRPVNVPNDVMPDWAASTFKVTSPDAPPPLKPVPAVTAVMSPPPPPLAAASEADTSANPGIAIVPVNVGEVNIVALLSLVTLLSDKSDFNSAYVLPLMLVLPANKMSLVVNASSDFKAFPLDLPKVKVACFPSMLLCKAELEAFNCINVAALSALVPCVDVA